MVMEVRHYVTSLTQAALSGTLAETLRSLREARHNWKGLDQLDNHMLSVSEHVYI